MAEKLKPSEIDKLRALVGLGEEPEERVPVAPPVRAVPASGNGGSPPPFSQKKPENAPQEAASFETELFVKIDEHAAVGELLAKSKGNMKSIADTVSLLAKAEKLKSDAIERMEATLDDIDAQIGAIESKIAAPEGLSIPELGSAAVDDELIDLRSELESLKGELGRINK